MATTTTSTATSPMVVSSPSDKSADTHFVEVSYCINYISNIEAVTSTFEVDAEVCLFWLEPKVIGRKEGEVLNLKKEKLFDPDIYVTNEHRLKPLQFITTVSNSKLGEVRSRVHIHGTLFITAMDLSTFPFDCQNLQIGLRATRLDSSQVVISSRGDQCALHHHGVHEWIILDHLMKDFLTDPANSSAHKEYSILFITVLVQRQSGWFIKNIFIMVGCILLFGLLTFLIDPVNA